MTATAAILNGDEDAALFGRGRRARPEAAIQKAIVQRLRWHGVLCHHSPNEGKRAAVTGKRLTGEGMRPGWPDLECFGQTRDERAFLEVKAPKGRLSPAQIECHAELTRRGQFVRVVTSQDEAVEALRSAGFRL